MPEGSLIRRLDADSTAPGPIKQRGSQTAGFGGLLGPFQSIEKGPQARGAQPRKISPAARSLP